MPPCASRGNCSSTDAQYGNLELAFGWAFAAGSLVFGFLADRLRVYFLYPAVLAAWSLMGMATGWTHGFLATDRLPHAARIF